jgi:hypothetical protein
MAPPSTYLIPEEIESVEDLSPEAREIYDALKVAFTERQAAAHR